jgi:hypothetical protein
MGHRSRVCERMRAVAGSRAVKLRDVREPGRARFRLQSLDRTRVLWQERLVLDSLTRLQS